MRENILFVLSRKRLWLLFVEVKVQGRVVVFVWFRRLKWDDDRKMKFLKFWISC